MERYTKATVADVQRYVKQYISLDKRGILHIVPQGDLQVAGADFDRPAPNPMPEPSFTPPAIQKAKLSNGLELLLVEDHTLPLIQANLVFKSGWAADPKDRPGSASLTAELLDEGTKTRNALQVAEEAKRLGANLGTRSSFDGSNVSINVLKRNFDPALALMSDVVLNPTFPAEELERQRQIYLGRIKQESKEPFTSAFKMYLRTLFGADHPYGQPYTGTGTESSIKAITRDDLVSYYKANYFPNNAAIVVVGDITLDEARTKLENAFKAWQPGTVAKHDVPTPAVLPKTKVCIIDKPGAAQSVVMVGNLGITRNAPDYMSCDVMNNALGGQFTSRVNMNLREDKGYTYGAGSFFSALRGVGPFACYAPVQTEVTKETITEMVKEIRDICNTRPLTDAELTDSKNNMIKSFPQGFETLGSIAGQLAQMYQYDLPADEWSTYMSRVNAIDGAAATKAARDHLHPDALLIVVVGDRSKIEPGIKDLQLGDIIYLDTGGL
jgi:zinc protease